jgi:hypothetical protein
MIPNTKTGGNTKSATDSSKKRGIAPNLKGYRKNSEARIKTIFLTKTGKEGKKTPTKGATMSRSVTSLSVGIATAALARALPNETNLHYLSFIVASAHDAAYMARRTVRSYAEKPPADAKKTAFEQSLKERELILNSCISAMGAESIRFVLEPNPESACGFLVINDTTYKLL